MNTPVTMKKLLESGAHFGHNSRYWNPKMKPYIFMKRQGVHIINLQKTLLLFQQAYNYVKNISANGGKILFVCTKKQGRDIVETYAKETENFYINNHWVGGLLSNLSVVRRSISRIEEIEKTLSDEERFKKYVKRDLIRMEKAKKKLEDNFGGVLGMKKLPDLVFVIDTIQENNCIQEAKKMNIPICALVDTNSNPEGIDVIIPSNDDAIRSINLFVAGISQAIKEGRRIYENNIMDTRMLHSSGDDNFNDEFPDAADGHKDADASTNSQKQKGKPAHEKPKHDAKNSLAKQATVAKESTTLTKPTQAPEKTAAQAPEKTAGQDPEKTAGQAPEKTAGQDPEKKAVEIHASLVKEIRELTGLGLMECKKALVAAAGDKTEAIRILKEQGLAIVAKKSNRETNEGMVFIHNDAGLACAVAIFCETDFVARNEIFLAFSEKTGKALLGKGEAFLDTADFQESLQEITSSLGEKIMLGKPHFLKADADTAIQSYLHTNKKIAVLVKLQAKDLAQKSKIPAFLEFSKDIAMQIAAMNPLAISSNDISKEDIEQERQIFLKQMDEVKKPEDIKLKIVEGKVRKYFSERCLLDMNFVKDSKQTISSYMEKFSKEHTLDDLQIINFQRIQIGKE